MADPKEIKEKLSKFQTLTVNVLQQVNLIDADQQAKAAWDVIKRIIPDKAKLFRTFVIFNDDNDHFSIIKKNNVIEITGNSGVAVTWGFGYYLKYYCNSHIGWQDEQVNIPDEVPNANIFIRAKDRFRYYQNVCTTSYSFAWWDINEWQKHIDWMALNGINLTLAPHGQEAIWLNIYKSLNLTDDEIQEHFSGPAFLSWQRMGNLRGWGGPLSSEWHQHSIKLQKFVVESLRNLGMIPALPSFAGFVPKAFKRVFPNAKLHLIETWLGFEDKYSNLLFLEPTDPLFLTIGRLFLTQITKEYSCCHFYYCDPFNEIRPALDDLIFLNDVGNAIFDSMKCIDPQAIWVLQNWMFVFDYTFWTNQRVETFLTSIPQGRLLILDLQSEQRPLYNKFSMYYGQPFIWCMLHNFGGTLEMFGNSYNINNEVYKTRNMADSTMVGIGLTMEGINQNYVLYDLMLETAWRDEPVDLNIWIKDYATRRYGSCNNNIHSAWKLLMDTVYNYRGSKKIKGKSLVTRRPRLDVKLMIWYSADSIAEIFRLFLLSRQCLCNSNTYRHDIVDIARQFLQYKIEQIFLTFIKAYKKKNAANFLKYSELFLDAFTDIEEVLSSHEDFLLGNWLESAKRIAKSEQDKRSFEINARNQITLWGPNGEICDYASKQWAGLISDYYAPRWKIFITELKNSLDNNCEPDMAYIKKIIFEKIEKPFTFSTKHYSTVPNGDCIQVSQKIYEKWSSINSKFLMENLPTEDNKN